MFDKAVRKHEAEKHAKGMTWLSQFLRPTQCCRATSNYRGLSALVSNSHAGLYRFNKSNNR